LSPASASLAARIAASPGASPTAQPGLCVTVQRAQASIQPGHNAAYTVQVATENLATAARVSVALTAQPSGLNPAFTGGCPDGSGTATCALTALPDNQPSRLQAQIPVGSEATSVTLTATASVVTAAAWTPPSAAAAVAVTAAPAPPASTPPSTPARSPASSPPAEIPGATLPLEHVPALGNVSSSLVDARNASGLFPRISPAATPSPAPGTPAPEGKRTSQPIAITSPIGLGRPALTSQAAGLIALATAILLTVTRLSVRRRFRSRKPGR
jgi:hypothetical protein